MIGYKIQNIRERLKNNAYNEKSTIFLKKNIRIHYFILHIYLFPVYICYV